jgi:hypothetical protein
MTGEPTLRHGDHEADGWVKYLQEALIWRFSDSGVQPTGSFDDATLHAVKRFQHQYLLRADGIVGDATWAALAGDAPAPEGVDGLAPHTHLDHAMHMIWTEHEGMFIVGDDDRVVLLAANVGDTTVPSNSLTACLTFAARNYMEFVELVEQTGASEGAPGAVFAVAMTGVRAALGPGTHDYVAELPTEVGGAKRLGQIVVE